MTELAITIFAFLKSLGSAGIFLSMFIENLGIPFPTEFGYLLGVDLINNQKASVFFMVSILTFGHLFGAILSYFIGKRGDIYTKEKDNPESNLFRIHAKLTKWYKKYGNLTIFFTRFIGYVRPWSSFAAGFAGVDFVPFVIWTTIGSLVFNIIALYFSSFLILVWRRYEYLHVFIVILFLLLFFLTVIYNFVKKRKKH